MDHSSVIESTELLWFCLKTQPKHEKLAAQFLRTHADLEVFCPLLRFQRVTVTGKSGLRKRFSPATCSPVFLTARISAS